MKGRRSIQITNFEFKVDYIGCQNTFQKHIQYNSIVYVFKNKTLNYKTHINTKFITAIIY